MRQSEENATRNGIQALQMAFNGILKSRQDVESTRHGLSSYYKGSDGAAYQELVIKWEEQADVILKNVEDMVEALNETLAEQGRQQGSANTAIQQQYNQSESVFDTLTA
ncbi:hypothetical protein [Streptomyces sp.]|uniref:hypothetical protein n=1 Tax=Streptomyces sp. TaxID=1931 RepID=UPI0039C8D61E